MGLAVSSAERCYAEWVIEETDANCYIVIGVTDLDAAPPAGQIMHTMPGSCMYRCHNSRAYPGNRDWGAAGRRARGERVGLLVERGSVWVYVDGARLGPGPMATDLPQRVGTADAKGERGPALASEAAPHAAPDASLSPESGCKRCTRRQHARAHTEVRTCTRTH